MKTEGKRRDKSFELGGLKTGCARPSEFYGTGERIEYRSQETGVRMKKAMGYRLWAIGDREKTNVEHRTSNVEW